MGRWCRHWHRETACWWSDGPGRWHGGHVPGEVVAVRDPHDPARVLVKRVGSVDRHKRTVEVLGDDASASTDSRTFGPVPRSLVLGKAVYRYAPAGRAGSGPWLPWPPGYDPPEGDPPGWFRSDPTDGSSATKGTA